MEIMITKNGHHATIEDLNDVTIIVNNRLLVLEPSIADGTKLMVRTLEGIIKIQPIDLNQIAVEVVK